MSRFETSTFVRNSEFANSEVILDVIQKLGWAYEIINDEIIVSSVGSNSEMQGEYALKIVGNRIIYNTYYLNNSQEIVRNFKSKFSELNVAYAKESILKEFKRKGFTFKSNDNFKPTNDEVVSFFMVGRSKIKGETEPVGRIKITILKDGTIVTDSDYLPDDVNKLAHQAMDNIEVDFGDSRKMTKKEVPLKYRDRILKESNKNIIKRK